MQISPLRLLIIGVVHELKPASDVDKLLHLRSLAFEICTLKNLPAKSLSAKDSQHNILDKQIDFQKRSKQVLLVTSFKEDKNKKGTKTKRLAKK